MCYTKLMKYILASTSPRRQELFKRIVSQFDIMPSFADENLSLYFSNAEIVAHLKNSPQELVKMLAQVKATEVAKKVKQWNTSEIETKDTCEFNSGKATEKAKAIDIINVAKSTAEDTDEIETKDTCEVISENSAKDVKGMFSGIVVGSDTGVFFENQMIGKPTDGVDATRILKELSGKEHQVISGVCCILVENGKSVKIAIDSDATTVKFNELSTVLVEEYVKSGLCFGKAGAYGIQDGFPLVEWFDGSFENVMGFPLELVKQLIESLEN